MPWTKRDCLSAAFVAIKQFFRRMFGVYTDVLMSEGDRTYCFRKHNGMKCDKPFVCIKFCLYTEVFNFEGNYTCCVCKNDGMKYDKPLVRSMLGFFNEVIKFGVTAPAASASTRAFLFLTLRIL